MKRQNLGLYIFVSFRVLGAICGAVAILMKGQIPQSLVKKVGLIYFALFCLAMSAVETFTGEIRSRVSGPPLATRADTPGRFWSQIVVQTAIGIGLLMVFIFRT